ncbi:unnamed protein product [Rotaria socialis]|uniref:Uncharacterized protein n=1 Tax=Rotaria socialis TaxID=392032 RepID=A0A821QPS7_9BILA|nr:unnamed protein product [Rotaria socialis]CAF3330033.1 unnamed protein product [Rotaria socialis]CAF3423628.1 unnamed protein product [Rotaria socialis]CAF4134764.1 unnamed protein product [Rotaria socialis]CAF4259818.1 unnamed protein product [Rotaria socialis]
MATASVLSNTDDCEPCAFCLSKYSRTRASFCQCKHCSTPLCIDCTKEHHDELLQEVTQISHRYNQLKELLQTKHNIIVDETAKSIEDVNQYFKTYIDELIETQKKIISDIEEAKQDAQSSILKIDSDLSMVGIEIHGLAKQNIAQTTKTTNLLAKLKSIEQSINTYKAIRTENLLKTKPEFSIKFDCALAITGAASSDTIAKETKCVPSTILKESFSKTSPLSIPQHTKTQQNLADDMEEYDDLSDSDDNNDTECGFIETTYPIDRMASDGENIMYSVYYDDQPDIIAYFDHLNRGDPYRDWNQSRIEDMIWWGTISKFICATEDAIYTVEYINTRFKILAVIREKWSYCRVAANTSSLFTWSNSDEYDFNGIEVYSTEFESIKTINFNSPHIGVFINQSVSFCITDNFIASLCTRMRNDHKVFQVTVCDLEMSKLYSLPLGRCSDNAEIRTDGEDQFFITTGHRKFYILHYDGEKQTVNLKNDGECIAVLHNRRIAVSRNRGVMKIINY